MNSSFNKYHAEVLRVLDKFKRANEWSDFIEPLDSLCTVFKKYNAGYVPCIPHLIKRLNQLLNPALPGGVHLKTIECYKVMFEYTSKENILKDFDVLTLGLFNFSVNCRIIVANEYLDLLEKIVEMFGSKLESFARHILFGFLPFLESEGADFYAKAYFALLSFLDKTSEKKFYTALWTNFIDHPDLRPSVINFLSKHKVMVIPNHGLVGKAYSLGLEVENPFVIRPILEMSNRDFPYVVDAGLVASPNIGTLTDPPLSEVSISEASTSSASLVMNPKALQTIKDLTEGETGEKEMEECNIGIIKGVLKIFLKKEVGMHKRAYKWLNISESITERDVDYIEKGLRAYLGGDMEDLSTFFKVVNAMEDRENLTIYLMERLILDAISTVIRNGKEVKGSYYHIKKNAKTFLSHSLDEFYRVIYMNLEREFEAQKDFNSLDRPVEIFDASSGEDSERFMDGANPAEQLLGLATYAFFDLDAVDANVTSIHIPLLCHLVIRNRRKISPRVFFSFLNTFIERCTLMPGLAPGLVTPELISSFYSKEAQTLLEINLISSLASELSRLDSYDEATEDHILWADAELTLQNGILVWADSHCLKRMHRNGSFFNFREDDVKILQKFMAVHGHKDFPKDFIHVLGTFLTSNYKFPELITRLGHFIDKDKLVANLWDDFIQAKNPKYLMHFPEELVGSFVLKVLPDVAIRDACLFLGEALRAERHYDVLFRVATTVDHRSSEFTSLLFNLDGTDRFIKNLLDRYYPGVDDPYGYDITMAVMFLVETLIDNGGFMKDVKENVEIKLEKDGVVGVQEALIKMVFHTLDQRLEKVITDGLNNLSVQSDMSISGFSDRSKVSSAMSECSELSCKTQDRKDTIGNILVSSSSINDYKRIYRFIFNILFKLHKRGISILIPDLDRVKEVIVRCKNDFYVMKRSLFLVVEDVEFIYKNYLHFYRPIFSQINGMSIKEQFFSYLIHTDDMDLSVEVMQEVLPYVLAIGSIKKEDLYAKCFLLIGRACQASTALYRRRGAMYTKMQSDPEPDSIGGIDLNRANPKDEGESTPEFKETLTEDEIIALAGTEPTKIILVKTGSLESAIQLTTALFARNSTLFVSSIPPESAFLNIFGAMPFRDELYAKILSLARSLKFPTRLLINMTLMLPTESRDDVIKAKADFLRSVFGAQEPDTNAIELLLELFRNNQSDLGRLVVSNILHSLLSKAELAVRLQSATFNEELKLIKTIIRSRMATGPSVSLLKTCCFTILSSRFREEALGLIALYFKLNPSCKVFTDAFIGHFYKNFFDFGILQKKSILALIATSPSFDPFSIINTLISRMDASIFSSAQSEELQRIASIKKMAFFILTQPKNKFSSMSDVFVKLINDLINTSSELRLELIRFSTVLMLKIDNHYLQTLFPILIADFMVTVFTKDLKVVHEIFRFVDISIWLKSSVFTFNVLFTEGHSFHNQLKSHLSYDVGEDLNLVMSERLPSFFTLAYEGQLDSWGQISAFLKEAQGYYNYIDVHMVERDYMRVEDSLSITFTE